MDFLVTKQQSMFIVNTTYNEAEASERALFSCEKKSYAVIVYSNIYGRVNSYDEQ